MASYIDKSVLLAEIERRLNYRIKSLKAINDGTYWKEGQDENEFNKSLERCAFNAVKNELFELKCFIDTLDVKEVDFYNNGWIDCTKQMPPETKQTSNTLQGHREWTESDSVLVWDSMYGCSVDATKNGKWMSERRGGYTGQVVHGIIAWRPIPEFSEELLFKAQKEE